MNNWTLIGFVTAGTLVTLASLLCPSRRKPVPVRDTDPAGMLDIAPLLRRTAREIRIDQRAAAAASQQALNNLNNNNDQKDLH